MPERPTRDRVLQVAQELFTTKGFANASIGELCREAGVSPPTVYYHFGSKDGLFEAVVEEVLSLEDFHGLLHQAVEASSSPRARLRAYVLTYLTQFPALVLNPGLHLKHSTQLSEASLGRVQTGVADIYQLARELLQKGIEGGHFRELDVDLAASCLMGTVDSFVRGKVYLGIGYDPEDVTRGIVDLFIDGLKAGSAEDDPRSSAAAEATRVADGP